MFKADYVVVFDTSLREQEVMPNQYLELIKILKDAGLVVTARPGVKDSDTILVLVRATNTRLLQQIENQARLDFIKGVHSPRANMQLETAADHPVPLTPAERLYVVDQILTTSRDKSTEECKYAGITPGREPFPFSSLSDVRSLKPWSTQRNLSTESKTSLLHMTSSTTKNGFQLGPRTCRSSTRICISWTKSLRELTKSQKFYQSEAYSSVLNNSHFGPNIAMYFAFLRAYFTALVPPSVLGFVTWASGGSFSPLYSFAIVLWSVLFVEWWRIRERIFAVRWGTYNASLATPRAQFKGTVEKIDPITGQKKKDQPWHVTELRQLFSVPVLIGAAIVLMICICGIFTTEVLLTEVYTGPGQAILKYLPIVLFAGIVPQVGCHFVMLVINTQVLCRSSALGTISPRV